MNYNRLEYLKSPPEQQKSCRGESPQKLGKEVALAREADFRKSETQKVKLVQVKNVMEWSNLLKLRNGMKRFEPRIIQEK